MLPPTLLSIAPYISGISPDSGSVPLSHPHTFSKVSIVILPPTSYVPFSDGDSANLLPAPTIGQFPFKRNVRSVFSYFLAPAII